MTVEDSNTLRTWIEVDAAALRHNLGVARRCAGTGNRILAVVKANGYGLGAVPLARALEHGVDAFGVATLAEAIELKSAGLHTPIHLLSPILPDEFARAIERGLIPSVSTLDEARLFSEISRRLDRPAAIHLVVDTGMGRIGVIESDALELAGEIARLPGIVIDSVGSHFPSADEDEVFTRSQQARFWRLVDVLIEAGISFNFSQIANSAGALHYPRRVPEMVRCGLMIFGVSPLPPHQHELQTAVTWKSRVILVRTLPPGWTVSYGRTFTAQRETRAATLAVGYADGYQRHLSNTGAEVLVGGRRCPVLGRVTMDQIIVDVSGVPDAAPGDEAVLIGRQGTEEITARELAAKAGTIPYEIFTGLGRRVARVYVG